MGSNAISNHLIIRDKGVDSSYYLRHKISIISSQDDETKIQVIKLCLRHSPGGKLQLDYASLDIVKGWTKASVIAFVVMALAEYNPRIDFQKIMPFCAFLDRAWLLPMNALWLLMFCFHQYSPNSQDLLTNFA